MTVLGIVKNYLIGIEFLSMMKNNVISILDLIKKHMARNVTQPVRELTTDAMLSVNMFKLISRCLY